jgi:hypothetical protein
MNNKRCLVLTLNNPNNNPRPNRHISLMNELGYDVDTLSGSGVKHPCVKKNVSIPRLWVSKSIMMKAHFLFYLFLFNFSSFVRSTSLLSKSLCRFYRLSSYLKGTLSNQYDIILVENIDLLPIAIMIKKHANVIVDLREYYPTEFNYKIKFNLLFSRWKKFICSAYLPKCSSCLTVSPSLVEKYKNEFGVEAVLIRSAPPYRKLSALYPDPAKIRIVHHGVANPDRKIENMIVLAGRLDFRFSLDLYLMKSSEKYFNYLKNKADGILNVRILDPVPFDEIVPTLNEYDIGLICYEENGENITGCLPNKFFEYIQARLMIVSTPLPSIKSIVDNYALGVCSAECSCESIADMLNVMDLKEIMKYKEASNHYAYELSFDSEKRKFVNLLSSMTCLDKGELAGVLPVE